MKAWLIFNPTAGQRDVRDELNEAMAYLVEQGWQIELKETRGRGDATTYARQGVAAGCQAVIVAGGDGTIGEAVNGLAGSETALGVFPVGTANVWALEMHIPAKTPLHLHRLIDSARALHRGRIRRVDLGRAGERYFLLWSGVGLDAVVTEEVDSQIKKRLGPLAFALAGAQAASSFRGTRARLVIDGRRLRRRLSLLVISNTQLYGAVFHIAPNARLDDGVLDIFLFKGRGLWATLRVAISVLIGRHLRDPQVEYYQARRVSVFTSAPLPVHTDGDVTGCTPMNFEVVPRALNIIVPPDAPATLFSDGERGAGAKPLPGAAGVSPAQLSSPPEG